jgi:hypothetical protein
MNALPASVFIIIRSRKSLNFSTNGARLEPAVEDATTQLLDWAGSENVVEEIEDDDVAITVVVSVCITEVCSGIMLTSMSVETLCPTELLVPVIRIVNDPGEAVVFATTIICEVTWPPEFGATCDGMDTATPKGVAPNHDVRIVTGALNPLMDNTVT